MRILLGTIIAIVVWSIVISLILFYLYYYWHRFDLYVYQKKAEEVISDWDDKSSNNQFVWQDKGCDPYGGEDCIKLEYKVESKKYVLYVHEFECTRLSVNSWDCIDHLDFRGE